MKAMMSGSGLLFAASLFVAAQHQRDSAANRSKIIAFETRGTRRKSARRPGRSTRLDNSLVYTDYDGTLKTKADFLASVKAAGHRPEPQVTGSMNGHVCGDTAVVTGLYRVKGVDQGKPYQRRGRFTDTWTHQNGTRVCVASQYTLMSH
jgi:uncharacterized protein DUF4440